MTTLQDRAEKANVTFVYLFVETETNKVFYVGTTRYVGRRMNEHRRDLHKSHRTPLYVYMRDNNLELFRNVEVRLVAYTTNRAEASKLEADYIERYKNTVMNLVKVDTRKYSTDPRYLKVRCVTTGEIFHAVKPAYEKCGTSRYKFMRAIERGEPVNGLKFEFIKV